MRNWVDYDRWGLSAGGGSTQILGTNNGTNAPIAPGWDHGAGIGGASNWYILGATPGDWKGNPDRFLSIVWTIAATSGQPERLPAFQFTFLEYSAIKTARALAGKTVTLSWQLRSSGCGIAPVVWRGGTDMPVASRFPWPNYSMQLWTGPTWSVDGTPRRYDWTFTLPAIPPLTDTVPGSYLGIGLDMVGGPCGPSIDIGPMRLNEGGPQDFEEEPFWKS